MCYTATKSVLIIEEYGLIRNALSVLLSKENCFGIVNCINSFKETFKFNEEIIIIGLHFVNSKTLNFLRKIKEYNPGSKIIVMLAEKSSGQFAVCKSAGADVCVSLEQNYHTTVELIKETVL